MFAAANTNLIQLFSTYTFENIGNLKGHNGKVFIIHIFKAIILYNHCTYYKCLKSF